MKISPEGMLRLPSELIQLRPFTPSSSSVPGASMRRVDAFATRAIRVSWNLLSPPHDATGSGWSRNSARSTNAPKSSSDMPASWALASVGQSVVAQRRFRVSLRTWRRARA